MPSLSPIYQQFGTSVNVKGHINQNGDSNLRSQLYVAAFSSLRCNAEWPRPPRRRPVLGELEAAEAALDVEGLVKAAVDGIERVQV